MPAKLQTSTDGAPHSFTPGPEIAPTTPGAHVDRVHLYVPPEEKTEVEGLGAHWDDTSKCWYIGLDEDPAKFSKWLPDDALDQEEFTIISDHAHVASTTVPCWQCHADIEVICIYCESGIVSDEPLTRH